MFGKLEYKVSNNCHLPLTNQGHFHPAEELLSWVPLHSILESLFYNLEAATLLANSSLLVYLEFFEDKFNSFMKYPWYESD